MPDFELHNHGSIVLLAPMSDAAQDWVAANLPEDVMKFGEAIVVEPRYIGDIVEGFTNDGLTYH